MKDTDSVHRQNHTHYTSFQLFLYELLDQFLILFVITLSAVLVWRGGWSFFDEFLCPQDPVISGWVSVGIGYGFVMLTFSFVEWKGGDFNLFEKYKEWRVFMYPLSISVLLAWRGIWMVLDHYLITEGYGLLISHIVSFTVLGLTKTTSNLMSVPTSYTSDFCTTPFQIETALGTASTSCNRFYKLFDYLLTTTVITVSTVEIWRSGWTALDAYVFPDHKVFSHLLSLLVGYTVIISFKLVEKSLKSLAKCSKAVSLIIQLAFCYLMGFAAINIWRATWEMVGWVLNRYDVVTVAIISHCLGMIALYISRSVINIIGCPFGSHAESLETLSIFDTTLGSVIHLPRRQDLNTDLDVKDGCSTKTQLIVSASPQSEYGIKIKVIK